MDVRGSSEERETGRMVEQRGVIEQARITDGGGGGLGATRRGVDDAELDDGRGINGSAISWRTRGRGSRERGMLQRDQRMDLYRLHHTCGPAWAPGAL